MDDLDKFCCQNKNCPKYGVRGEKNIHVRAVYGPNKTRLLYCLVCKKKFSERRGTVFFDSRLPEEKVVSILEHVVEGNGMRKTGRLVKVDPDTVSRYTKLAGEHAEQIHDELVEFSPETKELQFDEKWDFVRKKEKNCDENNPADARCGDNWDHVGLDAEHKLVLQVVNGKRTEDNTKALVRNTARCLNFRAPRLITSDEWRPYVTAILEAFGEQHVPPPTGFPSVHDTENQRAVQFHHVADGIWTNLGKSGSGSSCNPVEARKTAELVIKHFQNHPERSLGIITCNIRQQSEVETAVEKLRRKHPELEPFFSEDRPEPYFVKNLETVQGDERDVIIFGVGYGRDEHGTIRMNFGPLNKQGGERRLNVAVTRARYHVHLVSSIRSDAIDLNRVKSIGPQRLKEYLEYAETGTKSLKSVTTDAENLTESDFETQVMKELISQGLHVRSQVGCSGFRIDLALVDPEQPDRFVIGIECDGETYHRSATARDRDRLRQDVLEGLGWRIIRIWSTDWMMDSQKQVRRIVDFYKRRLEKIKTGAISHSSVPSVEQEKPTIVERPEPTQYVYDKIENVPQKIILQCIKEQYERHGKMPRKDMLDLVARQLGFKRTGHKIQLRVGRQVTQLVHSKEIEILE